MPRIARGDPVAKEVREATYALQIFWMKEDVKSASKICYSIFGCSSIIISRGIISKYLILFH